MSKRILKISARCNELEVIYKGCLNPRPLEDNTCVWQDAAPVSFVCELEGRHTLDLVRLQNSPSLWLPWSLETFSSQRTLMAAFIVRCFPIRGLVFLYRKS